MTAVLQKSCRRVIRTLRQMGYLEAGSEAAMATGYDSLRDNEPDFARPMVTSITQRIAFGERAGQTVRRIGSGFGYAGELPALTGPRCASVDGFSLHARQHSGASPSTRPVGALDSVHGKMRRGAGASVARGPWGRRVLVHK